MNAGVSARGIDRTITLLTLGGFASGANVRLMDPVLPQLSAEFAVTVGLAAQIVTAYALGYGLMQVGLGIAGDRFGKIRLVTALCFASFLACIAAAIAQSLGQLTLARFLCGAAASAIIPISLAWVGDMLPYDERAATLARYANGGILGMIAGQIVGGLVTEYWDWRAGLVMVALVYLTAGFGLLRVAKRDPLIAAAPVAPAVRLHPLVAIATMLRRPWSRIVLASVFVEGFTIYASLTFVGMELKSRFGLGYGVIGLMLAFFAVGGMAYTIGLRRFLPRFHQMRLVVLGSLAAVVGMCGFAQAPSLWVVPPAMIFIGFGAYMLHNTLQTFATQLLPEARATGFSCFATLFFFSQSIGVAVAALFVDRLGAAPIFLAASLIVAAYAAWFAAYGAKSMPGRLA